MAQEKKEKIELTSSEQDIIFQALTRMQVDAAKAEKLGKDLKAEGLRKEGGKFFKQLDELRSKFLTPANNADEEDE